jgi:hypothetical protein
MVVDMTGRLTRDAGRLDCRVSIPERRPGTAGMLLRTDGLTGRRVSGGLYSSSSSNTDKLGRCEDTVEDARDTVSEAAVTCTEVSWAWAAVEESVASIKPSRGPESDPRERD